jgi:hypothetical protein
VDKLRPCPSNALSGPDLKRAGKREIGAMLFAWEGKEHGALRAKTAPARHARLTSAVLLVLKSITPQTDYHLTSAPLPLRGLFFEARRRWPHRLAADAPN